MRTHEWTVYDSKTQEIKLVRASSQRDAWRKGARMGVIARHTNDVRPRTGDAELMDIPEFEEFFETMMESS